MEESGDKTQLQYHLSSQTDGQTEVTNRTLGTLLRALINLQSTAWDLLLPHAEFAFNKAPNRTTGVSPFKIVYGLNPPGPLDLIPRPMDQKPSANAEQRVAEIQKLHEKVRARIEKSNLAYAVQANKTSTTAGVSAWRSGMGSFTEGAFSHQKKNKIDALSKQPI